MNESNINAVGIDVSSYDQSISAFDSFIASIPNSRSPLSAMLDDLASAADEDLFESELARPVTFLEIRNQASSGLPSGVLTNSSD